MIKSKGYHQDDGRPILLMDEDEVKEREDLNIANTTSSLRNKVVNHLLGQLALNNGHGTKSS